MVEVAGVTVQVQVAAVQQGYKFRVGEMAWNPGVPVGSAFGAVE